MERSWKKELLQRLALYVIGLPFIFAARSMHVVNAYVAFHSRFSDKAHHYLQKPVHLRMVRNVDLPEAIIVYGVNNCYLQESDKNNNNNRGSSNTILQLLPGLDSLLRECREVGTAAILIVRECEQQTTTTFMPLSDHQLVLIHSEDYAPPNPRSLWNSIQQVTIQPRGYGGSSGFGRKAADPERLPLPKHVVVLCNDEDVCRAARFMGMRVIGRDFDSDLADAIVQSWDEIRCLDDIATPGSFWLNPPHPRDDDGNRVDPLEVMENWESIDTTDTSRKMDDDKSLKEARFRVDSEDIEMARILADLDPL